MKELNRRALLAGVIVIAAVILGIVFRKGGNLDTTQKSGQDVRVSENAVPLPAPISEATPDKKAEPPTPPNQQKPTTKLSYAEALQKYADTRIQLTDLCQAVPNQVVYKNGTSVMFDNRAGVERKIVFNSRSYTIGAYDFVVLPVVSPNLPSVTYVDCAEKQNVATIHIAK